MPFQAVRFDRVVLVKWSRVPTMADVRGMNDVLRRASREVGGQPLLYVALVPPALGDVPPPDVRSARVAALRDALSTVCESMDVVLLTPGLTGSIQRTVVRAMAIVSGMGGKVFIHDSRASAVRRLRSRIPDDGVFRRLQRELELAPALVEPARAP